MKKRYLIILALCCLMIIPLVGCSGGDDTASTPTIKTPIQLANDRINASDATNTRQDQNIFDLSNRITNEVSAITQPDLGPINARLAVLEALNVSDLQDQIASLTYQLTISESKYTTLNTSFYAHLASSSSPTPTPTPVGGTSTPTPTPTPIPLGILTKPVAIYPEKGNTSVPVGEINFEWNDCNASTYEFWFGNDPTNMSMLDNNIEYDVFTYNLVINTSDYYYWRIRAISGTSVKSSSFWFKTAP